MAIHETTGKPIIGRDEIAPSEGASSTIEDSNLSPSKALVSNDQGKVAITTVSSSEVNVLSGSTVPSNVTFEDDVQLVVNDSGTMRQARSSNLFNYIVGKLAQLGSARNTVGDIKSSMLTADHDGWVRMDGRNAGSLTLAQGIALTSIGLSQIPNAQGVNLIGSGGSYSLGSTGGSGLIAKSALPNITIPMSVSTGTESNGHTHSVNPPELTTSGSSSSFTSADQRSNESERFPISRDGSNFTWSNAGSISGSGRLYPYLNTTTQTKAGTSTSAHQHPMGHTHTFNIAQFNSGERNQGHTHTISASTDSINGGVVQTQHVSPYLAVNMFIFLG